MTEEQLNFTKIKDRHVLALASAGAGKTHSLIHFINDKITIGIKADEIISFSFTRKAANELKDRIGSFFKKKDLGFKYISTIHSFCWNELIKPFHKEIGFSTLPTIVHDIPDEFLENEFKNFGKKQDKNSFNKKLYQTISKDLQQEDFSEASTIRLLEYLVSHNLAMFDFMIHLANFVLVEKKDESNKIFGRVKYIIIDEAQDLNPAQYRFATLLRDVTERLDNSKSFIVMVGDFKQSIYKFRGSDPELINQFVEDFDPDIHILSYNFRSAPEIVDLANSIAETIDLGNDSLNASKVSKAANVDSEGEVFNIYDIEDFLEELKVIPKPLHETCILTRTNQAIKALAKVLGKLEIPYYMHTEYDILKRAEVKLFMNYLSLVSHGYNKALVLDIIKTVKGGIPLKMSNGLNKCTSIKDITSMFSDIKKIPEIMSVYNDLEKGLFNSAIPKIAKLLENPKKTAESMEQSLHRFYRDLNEVKSNEGLSSWMDALEELLFEAQFLEERAENKVQLMTVHKSKGLQWDNVIFLYDFSLLEQVENDFYDLAEEKRVVYTAVTRPKTSLAIWDISQSDMSDLLYKGKLENIITSGLKRGLLDISDFSKYGSNV